jgi:hypothetical protein
MEATITTLGPEADKYRRDGDSPFSVRVIIEDGREQTVNCWALDAWKARTTAMFLVTLRLNGCFITYEVTSLSN